ncbi:C2H2 transcription factor protein [Rutstroemia sp. NJR-2017a BBW]|nr:C2H2 transcription factor protein [Rutstroemia sp. NJR-2017a BBW]
MMNRMEDATTPTRATFNNQGALASQRPLPAAPFPAEISVPPNVENDRATLKRGNSTTSHKSHGSQDVDMDGSDDGKGSDDESVNGDGSRSTKKKKTTRFFCENFPPCALSFTRSEHLARHIRKHTGERPFVCHCSRRFSRLDNLRQHAQTVHLNEEIPPESLAATGTRFQRQVRTDKMRPASSRARAATATSSGNPPRGHHRNSLSTSSIGSVVSTFSQGGNMRTRPPPLQIYPDSPSNPFQFRPGSPGGFSTPTSATFSTGQNSPRWGSGVQSPLSGFSRNAGLYQGHHTPGRRLSVPSAGNPFSSSGQAINHFGPPAQIPLMSTYSPANGMMSSPTSSIAGSFYTRRDSMASNAEMDNRRRTWHPDTASQFTSRLQNVITPNHYSSGPPPPATSVVPSNAPPIGPIKLPGIESFDPLPRPGNSPRRAPSPMMVDTPTAYNQPRPEYREERPASSHLDAAFRQRFNHLEIQSQPQADAASWASDTTRAVQATAEQAQTAQPRVMFDQSTFAPRSGPSSSYHQHTASAPAILPRTNKRDGWYHGPRVPTQIHDQRIQGTSPEGSSSSEGNIPVTPPSAKTTNFNPPILQSNGYIETRHQPPQLIRPPQAITQTYYTQAAPEPSYTYSPYSSHPGAASHQHEASKPSHGNMNRLDALVAVATSEEHATTASY